MMFTPEGFADWLARRLGEDWTVGLIGLGPERRLLVTHVPSVRSVTLDEDIADLPDPVSVVRSCFGYRLMTQAKAGSFFV